LVKDSLVLTAEISVQTSLICFFDGRSRLLT